MAYWIDTYGKGRSKDFIDGVKAGVEAFAIWKEGTQYVGVMQKSLYEVFRDIERQLGGEDDAEGS